MKRPETNWGKISWFCIASVFLLVIVLAVGASTNAQAASGSFDRDNYFPSYGDTNDFDRAWISVTDSSGNTTSSPDTITVTIRAGSNSASFVLKETGDTTNVFTTTGSTQSVIYPVGTTSGYIEDFNAGSHNFPALGSSVVGLNLKQLTANTGGNATTGSDASLTVSSGSTLELLYGGATLDTAVIKTNSGSFSFTPSSVSAVTTDSFSSANLIISITDPDENLNPVVKDIIGFADSSVLLSGTPGTGSSRVQIEAIDQTTGARLSIGGQAIVAQNIMLVETGNNTGVFTARGKVFGSTTVTSSSLKGNIIVGSSSTSVYSGEDIILGDLTNGPGVKFKIIETNTSGSLGLVYSGSATVISGVGTASLAFKKETGVSSTFGTGYGTSSLSLSRIVAVGTKTSAFGGSHTSFSPSGLIKLIDGSNICLVAISKFKGTDTVANGLTEGDIFTIGNGGSVTVSIDTFQLAGPRSGDTLKVSYLDELNDGGVSGTVTGTVAYGLAGVTGTLAVGSNTVDINDSLKITIVDSNLNTNSSSIETVLWSGTTTNRRGDHLTITNYSSSGKNISVSHQDGFAVGTQSIRISNTDNTYVWMVPASLSNTFSDPLSFGSITISLGTQTVSSVPLVKGSSSDADNFLTTATTASFIATMDGLDNSVEISPNGTHWVSIPITETSVNSSTFTANVSFDYKAIRLTTNTSLSVTNVIRDFTGTSTLIFPDGNLSGNISTLIGTGSVVRVFDGNTQEFAEVASPGATTLSVSKLSHSSEYDPDETWVQLIGTERSTKIGGYHGATYRIRYNDAVGNDNAYFGGDTLAITTTDISFTTHTGVLSTDITGTSGPDTFVVVTLVDQDLNTSTGSKQSTFEADVTTSGTGDIIFRNENGLGSPSSPSTSLSGGTAKIVYASTLNNVLTSSVDQGSGGNTIDFTLVETDKNTDTFKGSFQLSSGTATSNSSDILKVSHGDSVYVYYNDSPNAIAADNSSSYTATSPITIATSLGSLSLSKHTAYLSGDTVVATVVDIDRNTSLTVADTLTTTLKVTGSNYSVGSDLTMNLVENGVNTGTFLATITTGTTTSGSGTDANSGTIKTVQGGIANVIYTDTAPSVSSATKNLSFSSSNATLAFDADSYSFGSYALVTLVDAERNTNISVAQSLLSDVFIQTSSANSTKVRMVETAADTGTFQGSIEVASSGDTTEFSKIKASAGDTLKITYIDEVNTTGSSRTVTDKASVITVVTPTPTPGELPTPVPSPTPTVTISPIVTPTPPTTDIIVSTVIDALIVIPIAGATVSADTGGYTATTDAAGSCVLDVPAGDYTVTASATGYSSDSRLVTVIAGQSTLVDFLLQPSVSTSPTPVVSPSPTPVVCNEPEAISVSPTSLTLKRKKSSDVTVTVTCNDEGLDGQNVKAMINTAGKKHISISPTSATTDASGAVTFTITAKKQTGSTRITFKAGDVKKFMTVRVR